MSVDGAVAADPRSRPALAPLSPRVRLALIAVALTAVAGVSVGGWIVGDVRATSPLHDLAWMAAFAAAELCAVRIHFRRHSHTFSLSEVPLVAALYTLTPGALVLVRCVGTVVALAAGRRQGPVKLAFNGALVILSSVVATDVFSATASGVSATSPSSWPWALVAALAGETLSMALIHVTLLIVGGTVPWQTLPKAFAFGLAAILVNGSVGLLVAITLPQQPIAILLVIAPAATMLGLYSAYATERRSHQRSDLLYEATRDLHRTNNDADVVRRVLHRVRLLLGADVAAVVLAGDADGPPIVLADSAEGTFAGGREAAAWLESRSGPSGATVVPWPGPAAASGVHSRGQAVVAVVGDATGVRCSMVVAHAGGSVRRFDSGDARLVEALASHIASALEAIRLSRRLERQAYHDALTGLPNRAQLTRRMSEALRRLEVGAVHSVGLLLVDLDDFKLANDSVGHLAGDRLLQEAGSRIAAAASPGDVVSRLGGDEFAILCCEPGAAARALMTADAVIAALHRPAHVAGRELSVRGSVGVAYAQAGDGVETLMRHADIAMYHAKERGKRRIEVFDPRLEEAVVQQLAMRDDLERAVGRREFEVAYQPIVDLATGRPCGVEALVRWRHPERGVLSPSDFIELAEHTGLIEAIGEIVLELGCRDLVRWKARTPSLADCTLSVNAAPRQLRDPGYAARVLDIVDAAGLRASDVVVEVTETALLENHDVAVSNLASFRAAGGTVALDDFGTGYSSLGYLRSLPVDVVKIDRSFVSDLTDDVDNRSMTSAIVRLLRTLDVVTVAEGIETQSQLDHVRGMGCDRGQGYFFARPVRAAEAERLLIAPTWLDVRRPLAG